ncbi:MAG TPA: BTAD domain-containing putative transcriptional regulator [Ktedonobacteraceae bacterium]|nr:BTAD domain-containing putative transcriptional regulator [Ktedonobacteraceae bacterium]
MDSLLSPQEGTLSAAFEGLSPGGLLEAGFLCVRQGRCIEGLAFFTLAREKLSPDQAHFAAVIDTFAQSHKIYSRAQEELLQASKHFAKADAERQMQLAALENLLSTLLEESNLTTFDVDRLQQNASGNRLLHILRPASEDLDNNQLPEQLPQKTDQDDRCDRALSSSPPEDNTTLPPLYITCFGRFEVKRLGRPVALCSSRHGQAILRYLVAQSNHCAASDTLMTLLWPEDEPEIAQPRLYTAIYALRRSLNHGYACEPGYGYIVCKNRIYYLSAAGQIQTDVDQFLHYYHAGRQTLEERVVLYEKACLLYTGPFLLEDRYADWSFLQREHLSRVYIEMCKTLTEHYLKVKCYEDAEKWATAILKENHCDEQAHRQLIQIYATQGRRSEALHQYQSCERILHEELAVQPLPETMQIVQMILKNDPSSTGEVEI